jgi:hypothetical protein
MVEVHKVTRWSSPSSASTDHSHSPLPSHFAVLHMASRQDKATTERNARTLRELVKRPDNKICADCKKNGESDPAFAPGPCLSSYRRALGIVEHVRTPLHSFVKSHQLCTVEDASSVSDALVFIGAWAPISRKSSL